MAGDVTGFGPTGKPHILQKGGIEIQDAGTPVGTRGTVDFVNATSSSDDPTNDRVQVGTVPPTGPAGPLGPAGPTGPGWFNYPLTSTGSGPIGSFPTRTSSYTSPPSGSPWMFQVTENVDNTGASSNDRIRVTGISISLITGVITVNYTTNDWGGGVSNSILTLWTNVMAKL